MTRQQLLEVPGINNVITFGKYKGKTILQVLDKNPSYLVWCIKNVVNFKINSVLEKELLKQYTMHMQRLENDNLEILSFMKKYNIHATEAMDILEYDMLEHF